MVAVQEWLTGAVASSKSLKSSFCGPVAVSFSAICGAASLNLGEKEVSCEVVKVVTFETNLILLYTTSKAEQNQL